MTDGVILGGISKFLGIVFNAICFIYVTFAVMLNNLHYLVFEKKTKLGWIPFVNIYLLGKIVVNKNFGRVLFGCLFLFFEYRITINGSEKVLSILQGDIRAVATSIYVITIVILIIKAFDMYKKLNNIQQQKKY